LLTILVLANCRISVGQLPPTNAQSAGISISGAIGRGQLASGGVDFGYRQPVSIVAPPGTLVTLASGGSFDSPSTTPLTVGLQLRQNYRLMVAGIPQRPGQSVYPSIELLDRLRPPEGKSLKYPIPIELTAAELQMAVDGKMVTRVIYLEDPRTALPVTRTADQPQDYFELDPREDPIDAAKRLGRPMAILRIGSRVPGPAGPDAGFLFGSPEFDRFDQHADGGLPPVVTSAEARAMRQSTTMHRPAQRVSQAWPLTR
jgi:hypothetical protein